jgi:hypothetical protein
MMASCATVIVELSLPANRTWIRRSVPQSIPPRFPEGRPNLADLDICITDTGTIVRASPHESCFTELVRRRWSRPGPTDKPVFNCKRADHRIVARRR